MGINYKKILTFKMNPKSDIDQICALTQGHLIFPCEACRVLYLTQGGDHSANSRQCSLAGHWFQRTVLFLAAGVES